jgi:SAM-dependent methyltransferase
VRPDPRSAERACQLNALRAIVYALRGTPRCPLCDGRPSPAGASWRHSHLRCGECGLIYVVELPTVDELRATYAQIHHATYQVDHKGDGAAFLAHKQRTLDALGLDELERSAPRRALDVGCGEGLLLDLLQRRGWHAAGIEINAALAAQAARRGLRVTAAPLEEATPDGGLVDLVVANHLLEHLRAPLEGLRRLAGWLRPGGCLIVETPLRPDFDNIDHLYCFSAAALDLALRCCGLRPRRWYDYIDDHYRHHNLAVCATSSGATNAIDYRILGH